MSIKRTLHGHFNFDKLAWTGSWTDFLCLEDP